MLIHKYWAYLQMKLDAHNQAKEYWKSLSSKSKKHSLEGYIHYTPKEEIFLEYVINNISKEKTIFEFGCNAGRCMRYLFRNGYEKLSGFDINEESIRMLAKNNNEMAWKGLFMAGELNQVECIFDKFDVSVTKGVLFNISPRAIKSVIKFLCKADIVIVFEGIDSGTFIHDYHSLFHEFNFKCIKEEYYPTHKPEIWKNIEIAKSHALKKPNHEKNKLLGIFAKDK